MTGTIARSTAFVSLALLAGACLRPPAAPATAGTADSPRTATTATAAAPKVSAPLNLRPLGDFSRTAPELLATLRLGWNLGNSLDVPTGETGWGNPPATPELFAAIAKLGFSLVRIPVTWTPHTGPAPDYVVDPDWLARVKEVVDYAQAAGLYAIINMHHDGADGWKEIGWLSLKDAAGKTTDQNNALVRTRFVAVWTQIAKYFANRGEELIFESMNEIHDGYGKPDPRHFDVINRLNQEFVSLVRSSGGNNAKRHLLIPGYNTNIEHTLAGFKLPDDPTKSRLIVSIHFYDPYLFALTGKTHTWGRSSPGRDDWGQEDFVVAQFDKLKERFVDQGIPIIMGEYGATTQDDYQDYQRYYMEYVTKAAIDRKIVPIYWDNGARKSGGEGFALIDRDDGSVLRPRVMEAMQRAATKAYTLPDIAQPKPGGGT